VSETPTAFEALFNSLLIGILSSPFPPGSFREATGFDRTPSRTLVEDLAARLCERTPGDLRDGLPAALWYQLNRKENPEPAAATPADPAPSSKPAGTASSVRSVSRRRKGGSQ